METQAEMQNAEISNQKSGPSPVSAVPAPELSQFLNYREYLKSYYLFRKKSSERDIRPYSYQVFSAGANIKSPNYLKMIIEGRRNLSDDMIGKFAKALALSKDQIEEFRLLVLMNQSDDTAARNVYLKSLSELRVEQKLKSGEIDRKTWEKIPNWTAWVIFAMIDQHGVQWRMADIKKILRPKASEDEIEKAVNGLIASGEISQELDGTLKKVRQSEAPEEIPVALVRKLQAQLMYLGLESLYQEAPTEREFGTLTLSLTKDEFEEIKFKLRQMRKAIHKDNSLARMKSTGERVYQLNIQLFPVTEKIAVGSLSTPVKTDERSVESLLHAASEAARVFNNKTQ